MVWLVLRNSRDKLSINNPSADAKHPNRYPLKLGEIIKFGRVAYKIGKIHKPGKKIAANLDAT